jgi:SAM-dependent methyltransferase
MMDDQARPGDLLRPGRLEAAEAWRARVRAGRAQRQRLREADEPPDLYRTMATRFGRDPRRTDDPALEVLRGMADPAQRWLDIGAGGGRYALPLALEVRSVVALEPSPSMLDVLRAGMVEHAIENVEVIEGSWPHEPAPRADVALMAHVGYDIEDFGAFLDAAEAAADRCVVVMRTSAGARASYALWSEVHGEERIAYPMLRELLVLLVARDALPEVELVDRGSWGYDDPGQILDSMRYMLGLRAGSAKDQRLQALIDERASQRDGAWEIDWTPMQDGVVRWEVVS